MAYKFCMLQRQHGGSKWYSISIKLGPEEHSSGVSGILVFFCLYIMVQCEHKCLNKSSFWTQAVFYYKPGNS